MRKFIFTFNNERNYFFFQLEMINYVDNQGCNLF